MTTRGGLGEQVIAELLEASHRMEPDALTDMLAASARRLGVDRVVIYVADLRQDVLVPLPGADAGGRAPVSIDGTLGGLAYRTLRPADSEADGAVRVWVPLVDGSERLGVIEFTLPADDAEVRARCETLASLAALLLVSKSAYTDTFSRIRRREPMSLTAEMEWAFMPPLTFATEQVAICAALEPVYEVGGDAYDYSLSGDVLHVSVFDAMGHDLESGLMASVSMASCRNSRRAGIPLGEAVAVADRVVARQFGGVRFLTAILAELDVPSGVLQWVNCGHPAPLLIRGGKVIKHLERPPRLPLGLGDILPVEVHEERLEEGDQVLFYTDGVIEARSPDGDQFGIERLSDLVVRSGAASLPLPEALRRKVGALMEFQQGKLVDDATLVLLRWRPDGDPLRAG